MNVLVTPIAAVLIGLFVRPRAVGVALYLAVEAVLFTFQTLVVLLAGETGFGGTADTGAFGPTPTGLPLSYVEGEIWAYGLVNLVVILIGVGIVLGIGSLRERRRAGRAIGNAAPA